MSGHAEGWLKHVSIHIYTDVVVTEIDAPGFTISFSKIHFNIIVRHSPKLYLDTFPSFPAEHWYTFFFTDLLATCSGHFTAIISGEM